MSLLPDADRILLGPGPSLTSPRVMRAMAAPIFCPDPVTIATRPSRSVSCMAGISALLLLGLDIPRYSIRAGSDDEQDGAMAITPSP